MAGYTRQSTFADGDTITAALFNNEYNQLLNAFGNTSGHKHDGTANEGPVIGLIGDAGETSPNNKVLIDTTNNYIEFYVEVASAPVQQLYIADGAIVPVTDSDVDLGTSSLYFKDTYTDTVTTTGNVSVGGNLTVTGNATISGNLTFGDADTDSINLAAEIDSDIIPNTDGTYDLGSATKEWQDLYIDGTANIDSLVADTADINGGTIDGATIATSDITVGAGKTLNVSAGTLTLADNQISGDKVEGGTIAATTITSLTATSADINGGTIDGTTIATSDITVGAAKTLDVSAGTLTLADNQISGDKVEGGTIAATTITDLTFGSLNDGTITVTAFVDEDNMVSNSATLVPTQQSVKAYVDSQVTAQDLDFQGDTGGALSIDLDSETLTIAGGTGLDTVGSGNTVTVNIDSTVATLTGTQTLTNKTLTSPVINTGVSGTAVLDDDTFATATATTLATSESIKAYVDTTVAATNEVVEDTTPQLGGDLDLNSNDITGTGNINITGTIQSSGNITGTLATAAQPNITSLGTLTGLTTTGNINLGDNDKAIFGAGSDLQIYQDGSNSYIKENGVGHLFIDATSLRFRTGAGTETYLTADGNGAVSLYYDNSEKIATTSTGAEIKEALTVGSSANNLGTTAGNQLTPLTLRSDTSNTDSLLFTTERLADGTDWTTAAHRIQRKVDATKMGYIQFGSSASDLVTFGEGSTEYVRIDGAGNFGIGTTNPLGILHLQDITPILVITDSAGAGVTASPRISFRDSANAQLTSIGLLSSSNSDLDIYQHQDANIDFWTNSQFAMRINSSGNVGIGTSSPASVLDVRGARSDLLRLYSTEAGGNAEIEFLTLNNASSVGKISKITATQVGADTNGSILAFSTSPTISNTPAERMRIDSSGNVGIGTTSPVGDLTVSNAGAEGIEFFAASGGNINSTQHYNRSSSVYVTNKVIAADHQFFIAGAEKIRIDSSGNLLVGKTLANFNGIGAEILTSGAIRTSVDSSYTMMLNRKTDDGEILNFRKDGTTVGSIGTASSYLFIGGSSNGKGIKFIGNAVQPCNSAGADNDNDQDLGGVSARWDDIYAANGTIQTSDRNEKQDIEALTDAETRVAVAAKGLLRKFRWKDAVAEKGDEARTHFGIIAQDLQDAFTAEGLDAGDYAMFISSTWTDDDGVEQTRLGVRYSELLAFIIAAI